MKCQRHIGSKAASRKKGRKVLRLNFNPLEGGKSSGNENPFPQLNSKITKKKPKELKDRRREHEQ
jgi:hypothetical protein